MSQKEPTIRKPRCIYCLDVQRVHKIDPKTDKELPDEWWDLCDCSILGDQQEIGFDCGKDCCSLYKSTASKRK